LIWKHEATVLILPTNLTHTVSTLEAAWLACSVSGTALNTLYLQRSAERLRVILGIPKLLRTESWPSIVVAARGHRFRDAQRLVCQLCFVGAGLIAVTLPNAPILTWQGFFITACLIVPEPLMVLAAIRDARDTLHMEQLESRRA
jgi:hypothetical protein